SRWRNVGDAAPLLNVGTMCAVARVPVPGAWRDDVSVTQILMNLAGGVALLLWGVRMVRTGMTRSFGAHLRRAVARYTRNRLQAFLVGLGVTALLQSSTATILIAGSFAARHLL